MNLLNNKLVQHSIYAGIVFLIVAHPKTFQLVDSVIKVHDKNALLFVHALVVVVLMYFGSLYIFEPAQKLFEGITNKPTKQPTQQNTARTVMNETVDTP
jgi:hypothetical protein